MTRFSFDTVLILGAHTDDEFGCSGTIARLIDQGSDVHYAVFSTCEESVPPGWPKDILAHEVRKSAATLGIKASQLYVYDFRVRHFPSFRQDILEEMVRLRARVKPDLVLLPSLDDMHQDHQVVAREGLRAFKFSSVLGYELPMNTITFQHACFVSLTPEHLQRKIDALMHYETQRFRPYVNEEFLRGLAKVRGVQAGVEFAEAFEVQRFII
jgi:LmbE family N-acetylglucosaminyl deacetylase